MGETRRNSVEDMRDVCARCSANGRHQVRPPLQKSHSDYMGALSDTAEFDLRRHVVD